MLQNRVKVTQFGALQNGANVTTCSDLFLVIIQYNLIFDNF